MLKTTTTQDRLLAQSIRIWMRDNGRGVGWGEAAHNVMAFKLVTNTDDELMVKLFHSGLPKLFPHAGRAEVQVVLNALRKEQRSRTVLGDVETYRRRVEWVTG